MPLETKTAYLSIFSGVLEIFFIARCGNSEKRVKMNELFPPPGLASSVIQISVVGILIIFNSR